MQPAMVCINWCISRSTIAYHHPVIKRATPVKNTGKRGLCYNNAAYTLPFSLSGQNSQVSWAYNWGQSETSSSFNSALEFVPMLWSNASDLTSTWAANAQKAINSGSTALLGFNEPDLCISGSACMDVASSVKAWKSYMQPFAGKALLGSPAVTNGGSPMGLTWLENFIGNCTGCTIDFINIHWYSNKWAGANYLEQQVKAARAIAGGRPIWITEFALDYSDGTWTDADVQNFLEEAMPWLDEQDDVHRYAYFMDTTGTGRLMNSAGTGMSDTGAVYNNYTEVSSSSSSSSSVFSSSSTAAPSASSSSVSPIAGSTSTYGTSTSATTSSLTISNSKASASSTKASSTSSASSTSKSSSSSSSTAAATATASASIQILSAYFADANVTVAARSAFLQNGNLVLNTDALTSALAISDPWWGTVKTLSILYSYNGATYVYSVAEQTGTHIISPSSIAAAAKVPGYATTQGATINIVACVWGDQQIKTQSVFDRIDYQQATGWGFQLSTNLFGVDGFWGHAKVGIIWYRDTKGVLKSLVARENDWVKF